MRIGASILYKNAYCYQSYNWQMMRPLGNIHHVIKYLEQYHVDEISIIRPVRSDDTYESFFKDVVALRRLSSMTPISFGGGIRNIKFLDLITDLPVEKLILSTSFIKNDAELILNATRRFGSQAIQALLPVCVKEDQLFVYNSLVGTHVPYMELDINFITKYANEIILYDSMSEGRSDSFNKSVLNSLDFPVHKIILSGGIGADTIKAAKRVGCAAVHIENRVLHREYSMAEYSYV